MARSLFHAQFVETLLFGFLGGIIDGRVINQMTFLREHTKFNLFVVLIPYGPGSSPSDASERKSMAISPMHLIYGLGFSGTKLSTQNYFKGSSTRTGIIDSFQW